MRDDWRNGWASRWIRSMTSGSADCGRSFTLADRLFSRSQSALFVTTPEVRRDLCRPEQFGRCCMPSTAWLPAARTRRTCYAPSRSTSGNADMVARIRPEGELVVLFQRDGEPDDARILPAGERAAVTAPCGGSAPHPETRRGPALRPQLRFGRPRNSSQLARQNGNKSTRSRNCRCRDGLANVTPAEEKHGARTKRLTWA